ncbi:MAG TPA: methionyl-tRNA formyltransferase [Nitriliruptorales bacterium]
MTDSVVRIGFFGTPDAAATCLRALAADERFDVALVVTNPDRLAGRGRVPTPPPVREVADEVGLAVIQPDRAAHAIDPVAEAGLDVAAVVAYGSILPPELLAATRHGFVNLHFSLLPRWRGAAPVQHAIRAGDPSTGVTAFLLDEGMDTGPILRTVTTDIGPRETAGELLTRLTELGIPVLADALLALVGGEEPTPQPAEGATLAPKVAPADVAIDWRWPAVEVDRLCRSADPRPGAHTTLRSRRLKVFGARPVDAMGAPGTVLAIDEGPVVACGEGAVLLDDVQPDGRARMTGRDLLNGQQVRLGELLGHDD